MLEVRPFSPHDRRFAELVDRGRLLDWEVEDTVRQVVRAMWTDGDGELLRYMEKKFHRSNRSLRVAASVIADARREVSEGFLTALSLARVNARRFHEDQRRVGSINCEVEGSRLVRQIRPLKRVGILCGGSFSSLLMHAVPAQMAGVGQVALAASAAPDGRVDPRILATAAVLGIDEVYRMDGSHAVAAFALGTDAVPRVDKVVGLTTREEEAAGRMLSSLTGVSGGKTSGELVIIADEGANARFIAADLVAQAEHPNAFLLVLLTDDRLLGEAVRIETARLVDGHPRAGALRRTLEKSGSIFLCADLLAALEAANRLAPSRLSLQTRLNEHCLAEVESAGAVFLGPWSLEASDDGFSGVNPFLPGAGRSRFDSGLGMDDFMREVSVIEHGPDRLLKAGRHLSLLAEEANLPAHAMALRERLELLRLTVE